MTAEQKTTIIPLNRYRGYKAVFDGIIPSQIAEFLDVREIKTTDVPDVVDNYYVVGYFEGIKNFYLSKGGKQDFPVLFPSNCPINIASMAGIVTGMGLRSPELENITEKFREDFAQAYKIGFFIGFINHHKRIIGDQSLIPENDVEFDIFNKASHGLNFDEELLASERNQKIFELGTECCLHLALGIPDNQAVLIAKGISSKEGITALRRGLRTEQRMVSQEIRFLERRILNALSHNQTRIEHTRNGLQAALLVNQLKPELTPIA
jgi:hypothetical protein